MSSPVTVLVGSDFSPAVVALIARAKKTIEIIVYDWRWYENQPEHPMQKINIALIHASRRGVKVRAVLNARDQADLLCIHGISARALREKRVVHTKLIVIDGEFVVIGSHNFTSNACTRNIELSLVLPYSEEMSRLHTFFENLYTVAF